MFENNELVKLVVAVLRGMNANAETMEYIIRNVGIEDETRHQLNGGESVLTRLGNLAADDLVDQIASEIAEGGTDIVDRYELSMYNNEVSLEDIEFDESTIRHSVRRIVEKHFEII